MAVVYAIVSIKESMQIKKLNKLRVESHIASRVTDHVLLGMSESKWDAIWDYIVKELVEVGFDKETAKLEATSQLMRRGRIPMR